MQKDFNHSGSPIQTPAHKIVVGIEGSGKSSAARRLAIDYTFRYAYINVAQMTPETVAKDLARMTRELEKGKVLVVDDFDALDKIKCKKEVSNALLQIFKKNEVTVIIAADKGRLSFLLSLQEYAGLAVHLSKARVTEMPKINRREAKNVYEQRKGYRF